MTPIWSMKLFRIAESFHHGWYYLRQFERKLHARNVCQVLGRDLKTPSRCVLCWTRSASGSGGTGQAIRVANAYKIPVFDFAKPYAYESAREFLGLN